MPSSDNCSRGSSRTFTCTPCFGTGPYSYRWNDGTRNSSITARSSGTYTCTVTDARGATCQSSATLTIR
jgi:hypothetical protein